MTLETIQLWGDICTLIVVLLCVSGLIKIGV